MSAVAFSSDGRSHPAPHRSCRFLLFLLPYFAVEYYLYVKSLGKEGVSATSEWSPAVEVVVEKKPSIASGTVLWAEGWSNFGTNSTTFTSCTLIDSYSYDGRTGYMDNATSVTYTANNNVRATTSSGGNCSGGHLWFNKSVAGELTTSAIKLYGATELVFSHSQGTSGSSVTSSYSTDGGTTWTELGTQSGAIAEKTYTFTVNAGTESIMIKLSHPANNAKNTRVDNLKLAVK